MKKIVFITAISTIFAMADFIGGEVDLGFYSHSPSGTAQNKGDSVDIENDLNWKNENDIFFKAYFEHPIPIIPNIKVGYTGFTHEGDGTASKKFSWGGLDIFSLTDNVYSKLDLSIYDIALYYEFLDNWISLDAGVNIKYLDGSIDIDTTTKHEHNNIQVAIPMLYGKAKVDIPTTDLSFQAEGNYISYDKNSLYDLEIGARYSFALGFGIEGGYKAMKIKIDNVDDVSMDANFNGAYGKVVWDF